MKKVITRSYIAAVLVIFCGSTAWCYPKTWHTSGKKGLELSKGFNSRTKQKQIGEVALTGYFTRSSYMKGGLCLFKYKRKRRINMRNTRFLASLLGCYTFYDLHERIFINGGLGMLVGKKTVNIMLGSEIECVLLPYFTFTLGLFGYLPCWKGRKRFVPYAGINMGIKVTF